jgi:hypothetical protein
MNLSECPLRWRTFFLGTIIFCVSGASLAAQSAREPLAQKLPPDTMCYVQWRGMDLVRTAEKTNHVLELLQAPDLAPIWASLAVNLQKHETRHDQPAAAMGLPEIISLMDNPAVFGLIPSAGAPETGEAEPGPSSSPGKARPQHGGFLVYDATGKRELIEKLRAQRQAQESPTVQVTHFKFGGIEIEARTEAKSVSYTAFAGHYFLVSDRKQIIEELVSRFNGSGESTTSVKSIPQYDEVHKFVGADDAVEFFARVPDLNEWQSGDAKSQTAVNTAKSMHVDRIRVGAAGLSFHTDATQFRGEVLGDSSAGGLFDLIGDSSAAFQTQPVLGTGTEFNVFRLNLGATYQMARGAIVANATQQQAAGLLVFEAMAPRFIGMPLPDALALFTGEFASITSFANDGKPKQLYATSIQKPDEVLKLLRTIAAPMILAEDSSNGATYLNLAYPYRDPKSGAQLKKPYYVAVTLHLLLAAPSKDVLRLAVDDVSSNPTSASAAGLFAKPEFLQMRSLLPGKLSGLSGADIAAFPWDKIASNAADQIEQATKRSPSAPAPDLTWLKVIQTGVISRHLHMSVSGSWKDSNGIYFDSYVQ